MGKEESTWEYECLKTCDSNFSYFYYLYMIEQ